MGARARTEVEVRFALPEELADPVLGAACLALLDERERDRHDRMAGSDRDEFLLAHAVLRDTVARWVGVEPARLRFSVSARGKPLLDQPAGEQVHVSLTHTRGLVACAVARVPVGVDIEAASRPVDDAAFAARYFAPDEVAALERLDPAARRARFFELWTLKEAYHKARDLELPANVGRVAFSPEDGVASPRAVRARARFHPALDEREADWHFEVHRPTAGHVLAVAARAGSADCRVSVARTALRCAASSR